MSRFKIFSVISISVALFVFGAAMMDSAVAGEKIKAQGVSVSGELFAVSGEVTFPGSGDVFISLLNQKETTTDMVAPRERVIDIKLSPEEIKEKKAPFRFTRVRGGEYCIWCFQDNNGNGKFDEELWATPEEPEGSYRSCFPFYWDVAKFKVDREIHDIAIPLE